VKEEKDLIELTTPVQPFYSHPRYDRFKPSKSQDLPDCEQPPVPVIPPVFLPQIDVTKLSDSDLEALRALEK
jgi:hypothetical protein